MRTTLRLTLALLVAVTAAAHAQSHSGSLAQGDATRESGQYMDSYEFQAAAAQQVTVTMTSNQFDTYLIVQSPSGVSSENDDYGPGLSQVDLIAGEAGRWRVMASSYGSGETGDYEVNITLGKVGKTTTTEGRLDNNDEMSIKGEYFDTHSLQLKAGSEYYLEVASLGFDGYLSVRSPSGQFWRNDDAGSTELSRIGPLAGEAGNWTIYVTSAIPEQVGAYDLRVISFE